MGLVNQRLDEEMAMAFEQWLMSKGKHGFLHLALCASKNAYALFFAKKPVRAFPELTKTYGKIVETQSARLEVEGAQSEGDLARHKAMTSCMSVLAKDADRRLGKDFKTFLKSPACAAEMLKAVKKYKLAKEAGLPDKAAKDLVPAMIAIKTYQSGSDIAKRVDEARKKHAMKPGSVASKIAAIQKKLTPDYKPLTPKL